MTRFSFTFSPSNESSQRQCATVPIIDDTLGNEPDEQFSVIVVLSEPSVALGQTLEICVTILDDDSM